MDDQNDNNLQGLEEAYGQLRQALAAREDILQSLNTTMANMDRNLRRYHNSLERIKLDLLKVGNHQEELIRILS